MISYDLQDNCIITNRILINNTLKIIIYLSFIYLYDNLKSI